MIIIDWAAWWQHGHWPEHDSDVIPVEERCWKCDVRRIADDSPAGLCHTCRDTLRSAQDAA